MSSAFTHALVGASGVQLIPDDLPKWRVALVFAVAAVAPDLDVAAFSLGIPYGHMLGHRGFSHSLLCAALLAAVASLVVRRWSDGGRTGLLRIWVVAFLVVALHGALDAATDAGLGIGFFIPFSSKRYFFPFRPIATSSVNPFRFFSARGLAVLASEALWVWLPLGLLSGLLQAVRWWRRFSSRTTVEGLNGGS
ncbi:MAG: metal-dependent hydrolase [Acidobacteria bacterium]|nr:metal-dependent hydrolase [Acidobacteriota bacterium]